MSSIACLFPNIGIDYFDIYLAINLCNVTG
jgi:hypothetical protein